MCGVFGWFRSGDRPLDLAVLKRIAIVTESRGRHAWGIAWIDGDNRLRMYKRHGPISKSLDMLNMASDARAVIGHCRYATAGDPWMQANNHPHPCDGGWIVHNGQVGITQQLRREYNLHRVSECDSEYVALLMEQQSRPMRRCLRDTARLLDGQDMVVLGLWNRPRRLIALRRGKPLYIGRAHSGCYLASLPDEVPGRVAEVSDNAVLELTAKGSKHETVSARNV